VGGYRHPCPLEGAGEIPHLLEEDDQLAQPPLKGLGQALPLRQNPLLKMAGEQLALILLGGSDELLHTRGGAAGSIGRLQSRLKLDEVQGAGSGVQLHGSTVGQEDGASPPLRVVTREAGRRQLLAQRGEGDAEASASGIRIAPRPEQLDEYFPGMGAV